MSGVRCFLVAAVAGVVSFVSAQSVPGHLDPAFVSQDLQPSGAVDDVLVQDDDKVLLLSRLFSTSNVRRLNPDGSNDQSFSVPRFASSDYNGPTLGAIAWHDGGILLGGTFTNINGASSGGIARLNRDGSLDRAFNMGVRFGSHFFDNIFYINALAVQPDGKILVGGRFHTVGGQAQIHLARLNANGTHDTGFRSVISQVGASEVLAIVVEPEGSIIVAGTFLVVDGAKRRGGIVRLKQDGSLDSSFDSPIQFLSGPINLERDDKGRILLVSDYSDTIKRLVRLQTNGQIDPTFDIGLGSNERLREVKVQPDGKLLVAGDFVTFAGKPRKYVARLNTDGTLDETFDTSLGPDLWVYAIALQNTNRVLIGGIFNKVEGSPRLHLARLFGGDPAPAPPSIVEQPKSLAVEEGDNAVFQVAANGFPLAFNWRRNGTPIAGATNTTLTLFNTSVAHAGLYQAIVRNSLGEASTDLVSLDVAPRQNTQNLVLNPSFEEASANASRPNTFSFFGVTNWTAQPPVDLFRFPSDVPLNYRGKQMSLHGSNYVGFISHFFSSASVGGVLTGRLSSATIPGGRYEFESWFSRAELSAAEEVGVEVLLMDGRGEMLSLGTQAIANISGWERFHRTVITSRNYGKIILRGAKAKAQAGQQGYVYADKLSLAAITNTAPALVTVPVQVIAPFQEVLLQNKATDTDITDAALGFSLDAHAPKGMVLDPLTGVLRWTPNLSDAGTTNLVLVKATYNGSDVLSSTNVITLIVPDALKVSVGEARLRAGENGDVPLMLDVYSSPGSGVTNLTFRLNFPANRLINLAVTAFHPSLAGCTLAPLNESNAVLKCVARSGQALTGRNKLADLSFNTLSNQTSAFFDIMPADVAGSKDDGAKFFGFAEAGRIGVVGAQALLEADSLTGTANVKVYGPIGRRYQLESSTNLFLTTWQALQEITLTNFPHRITGLPPNLPALFLRVRESP